jgi:transporter family-2 protein
MNWMILFLVFLAGAATAIQAGVNGGLGKKIGIIEAAFVSFVIGTVFLFILLIFLKQGNLLHVFQVPRWQLTGGLLGATYILIMVVAVPKIGIASSLVTLIVGQLFFSTLIDHFGLLGNEPILLSSKRMGGFVLMAIAIFLFYKK